MASLCGKTVSVQKGTTEPADAAGQSAKGKLAGRPAVTVLAFLDQNGANLALSSRRPACGSRALARMCPSAGTF